MSVVEDLRRARTAFERREWVAAYDALSDLDAEALSGDDFAALAAAAYFTGRRNDFVHAMQRAYNLHLQAGRSLAAARCAFWLARTLLLVGETAVGAGWAARVFRLVEEHDSDVVERGYAALLRLFRHVSQGEFAEAEGFAHEVGRYARQFGDPDLLAMSLAARGRIAIVQGRVGEGLGLLDEAMVGVAADEVSTLFAGTVYCMLIDGCQDAHDFGRAAQWTSALSTWCQAQPGLVAFTGQCALHRGQLMRRRGAFVDAIDEFDRAIARYVADDTRAPAGIAAAEKGDAFRILGRWQDAEASYRQARDFGFEPQPGVALLWLARGRTGDAAAAMRRVCAELHGPTARAKVLPAAIDVALAVGDIDVAERLCDELAGIATDFGSRELSGAALRARASIALARGDYPTTVTQGRAAVATWSDLAATYEVATCTLTLGRALRELGDESSALAEIEAARAAFIEVGAEPDAASAAKLLAAATSPAGLTAREIEVLGLVAAGRSNADIARELFLSEKTVARHLSNIFVKTGATSRTAAAAFAHANRLV